MPLDVDTMRALGRHLSPDPLTGEIEMSDIIQFITMNPDHPDVKKFFAETAGSDEKRKQDRIDAQTFDLSTLSVQPGTAWLISLEYSGLSTEKTIGVDKEELERLSREQPQHTFQLFCYIKEGPGTDGGDNFRTMEEFVGMPNSRQVESFIRVSMAKPITYFKPSIPNTLCFSFNLTQHQDALLPFLNSFPFPFNFIFEPAELSQRIKEKTFVHHEIRFKRYMKIAQELKDAGNTAYAQKNREEAIKAYAKAVAHLEKTMFAAAEGDERETEVKAMMAVCFANSSAARMIPGEGFDAAEAVKDAEAAIESDANYAKAYIRLSRAHEALGDAGQAQEAITRALRRPQLENHHGLVDHLISLQTEGKGIPQDRDSFQAWLQNLLVDDQVSRKRMQGIGGEWRMRCEKQKQQLHIDI
ncbi:hypothetical protein B0H34DRAFT_714033 [Crassisporium funariophilum]|nr:hypothetical protein B0H34DRAFT_714033 [Crassisporium funariophilum]